MQSYELFLTSWQNFETILVFNNIKTSLKELPIIAEVASEKGYRINTEERSGID